MIEPIENLYFNWLCAKVTQTVRSTPSLRHDNLFRILHNTEFKWLLSGDDNRAADGVELRREFILEADIPDNPEWRNLECSVFEMLIAFSRRAEFETEISAKDWFWKFLNNLNLDDLNDATNFLIRDVEDVLLTLVWRQYKPDGFGGLFPLDNPTHDQTKVEIWYQFCEYLVDQELSL